MCNLPASVLMTVMVTWGGWSEQRHCSVLNFPSADDGDLINEAQPRPFPPLMLIKQSLPGHASASNTSFASG